MTINWQTPPRKGKYKIIQEQLKANKGEWAKLGTISISSVYAHFNGPDYERRFVGSKSKEIYVRYVGN
jgi:hypothetical protein